MNTTESWKVDGGLTEGKREIERRKEIRKDNSICDQSILSMFIYKNTCTHLHELAKNTFLKTRNAKLIKFVYIERNL